MAKTKAKKPRFVCGIDFGTTFTSVAFAHSASPDEVKLVQTWPNGTASHELADDVPSEVHYLNHHSNPRTRLWGYGIPKDRKDAVEPLKWFKLLLQENPTSNAASEKDSLQQLMNSLMIGSTSNKPGPPTTPLERTAQKLKNLNVKPVDVVTDFLTSIRELAVKTIAETYDKEFAAQSKVEYVLTIPAIWTDHAKSLVVQAAQKARLGTHRVNFNLCSEPEAAAAYTFRAIQPHSLKCGECFVVCDAGGGTCDLVSYEIESLIPLKLNEAVRGSGDLCGSIYLDQGFDRYIRRLLGNETIERMKPRSRQQMEQSFQRVKIRFGNATDPYFEVNVPGIPDNDALNIEDGFHSMSSKNLQDIFDPVVDRIVELVRQQVLSLNRQGKTIAAILLVGGFGSSAYLKKRLDNTIFDNKRIQVIQPVYARTAIVRGALIRGLDGSIVYEKRCRKFYGSESGIPYVPGMGLEDHRYWNSALDTFYVKGYMSWYLRKDDIIGDTVSVKLPFFRHVPVDGFSPKALIFESTLMECDLDHAPDYFWKNPTAIRKLCTVRSDLSKIPLHQFQIVENCLGLRFYRVFFDLRLSVLGEVLNFELLHEGKQCGKVTAKFE